MTRSPESGLFAGVAWSPDSQRIAVLQISRTSDDIQIWDATTGGNLVTVRLQDSVSLMTWSPNGKWIALAGLGADIEIVDAQTGKLVHGYSAEAVSERLPVASNSSRLSASLPASGGPSVSISSLIWSPNSQHLAVTIASGHPTTSILDAQTGTLVHHFADDTGSHIVTSMNVASWSSDGKYLAAFVVMDHSQPMVWVWDTFTYQVVFQQNVGSDQIVWQPHSDNLAFTTGWRNPTIVLWDVTKKKLLNHYTVATTSLFAWSPDGVYLAFVNYPNQQWSDHRIVVINAQSGQQVCVYTKHSNRLLTVAWSPDGKYIVSAETAVVNVWVAP
jgi:WD40 repeat protein